MFIDESGEASIQTPDLRFNTFVLCGVIFNEYEYISFDEDMKKIKKSLFGNENIIFHSYCMRKQRREFEKFKDESFLNTFYKEIGRIFQTYSYTVVSCVIDKNRYRLRYPHKDTAYEEALMFLCERCSYIFQNNREGNVVHLCLEKRSKDKDRIIKKYYTKVLKDGTQFRTADDLSICHPKLEFRGKAALTNGIQFADLCAYPIARKTLNPDKPHPTYSLFENKIYCNIWGDINGYGIKHFP